MERKAESRCTFVTDFNCFEDKCKFVIEYKQSLIQNDLKSLRYSCIQLDPDHCPKHGSSGISTLQLQLL